MMHTKLLGRCTRPVVAPLAARYFGSIPAFATVDPYTISGSSPGVMHNLVAGQWKDTAKTRFVKDPLNGDKMLVSPDTQVDELQDFIASMANVSRSGQHNIYKSPERFLMYGDVFNRVAEELRKPDVFDYFVKCIQRVMPKSYIQAHGEVLVVRKFFENFSGDNVRSLMRGFIQAGDHGGQRSVGYRWPYGPVAVISPFNFPLEIPVMQVASAAMVGNKPVIKPESRVAMPTEQFLRLMHHCGLPKDEIDLIHCPGRVMNELLRSVEFRMTQFTGGTGTGKLITDATHGHLKLEDAGLDWKVLGPMPSSTSSVDTQQLYDYVAWQCDQDAYALSGQKCSAQSVALVHEDWVTMGLLDSFKTLAERRSLNDLTLSPILSHTNDEITAHVKRVLAIPKSKLLFGGKALEGHTIPSEFGAYEPTAVSVDLKEVLSNKEYYKLVTEEMFGPFQIVATWKSEEEPLVIEFLSRMEALLTAAVVSNDPLFVNRILGATSNGTTYCGLRSRTTGAPANHWFGPAGSPLAAGIGSREAVLSTWTCHREIVYDEGPVASNWTIPPPS